MMDPIIVHYLEAFEELKKTTVNEPSWLRSLREEAMAVFAEKGFPTTKEDAWRFTDVTPVRETMLVPDKKQVGISQADVEALKKQYEGHFVLFINGQYSQMHSSVPDGIRVLDLRKAIPLKPELLKQHLGRHADPKQNGFVAMNTAFSRDGIFLHIPAGKTLEKPVHLVFLAVPEDNRTVFYPRLLIVMGKGSKATFVETYLSMSGEAYLTNAVSEIVLDEKASLDHYKIQREGPSAFHIATTQVVQGLDSHFTSLAISLGAKLMRQDFHATLAKEGTDCALSGLYLAAEEQLLDHHTFIDHQKPSGKSRQLFKGILAGHSRGVFSGKVMVRKDAQQTDATQTNKNLILSDDAKADTQPQLEILADNVKCSHGAAVGKLEEDAIFYLKSRGIGERQAMRILAQGFAQEVVEASAQDFIKDELMKLVNRKLKKQFA